MECERESPGIYLAYFIQGLILLNVLVALYTGDYFLTTTTLFAFLLTMVPYFVERNRRICLPWEINLLIVISIYLHVAGHVSEYYITIPFYDKIAHLVSSITISVLGFVSVLLVDRFSSLRLTRPMIVLFIVIFTMALGAFWEIYEFAFDRLLGTDLQHGLEDTMYDLIFNLCGALIIAGVGNFYLRRLTKEQIVEQFVKAPIPKREG